MELDEIEAVLAGFDCKYVTVTGGEPLAQPNCIALMERLCDAGHTVSLETSGAMPIEHVDKRVSVVMDLKTPASMEADKNRYENISHLKPSDQVKFVICDEKDYQWSKAKLDQYDLVNKVDEVLFWMFDQKRLGRKSNSGFYSYDDKGKRTGLWEGLAAQYPVADDQPDLTTVQHRLMFAQVLEAVRALEENVLEDIREGDVGAILGWGFAPWSGGPFSWLDIIGTPYAAERCDELEAKFGARFKCPDLLREMAAKGQSFYGRFGKNSAAA